MNFTKEEITLCKKITEKRRKEINQGDWLHNENYIEGMWFKEAIQLWKGKKSLLPEDSLLCNYTPLWQISDCLEFLKGKCKDNVFLSHDVEDEKEWWCFLDEYHEGQRIESGKTPLEACLKAVLAILEEK